MTNNETTTEQATVQDGEVIGKYIRFQFDHLFQTVKCKLKIISVKDGIVKAKIPSRVMSLPFPPFGKNNNIVAIKASKAMPFIVK